MHSENLIPITPILSTQITFFRLEIMLCKAKFGISNQLEFVDTCVFVIVRLSVRWLYLEACEAVVEWWERVDIRLPA